MSSRSLKLSPLITGYAAHFAPVKGSLTVEGIDVSDRYLKLSADSEFYTTFPVENSALKIDGLGELSIVSDLVNGSSLKFHTQSVKEFGIVKPWIIIE